MKKLCGIKGFVFAALLCVVAIGFATTDARANGFEWAIEPQFEQASSFSEGLAAVRIGGQWGFIDTTGHLVIEPQFYRVWSFSEGLAAVEVERNLWGFIDITGDMIIEPQFHNAFRFFEGFAAIANEQNRWGFINMSGDIVIEPQFHNARRFSNGLANVATGWESWGFIDTEGNMVIEAQFRNAGPFSEGLAGVAVEQYSWGFINTSGEMVIEPQFFLAGMFFEGLATFGPWGNMGFIDTTGSIAIEQQFKDANPFSEGLTAVEVDWESWGFIDKQGNIIIEPQFLFADSFSEGFAAVEVEVDKWGFIAIGVTTPPAQPSTQPSASLYSPTSTTRTLRFAIGSATFTDNGQPHTLEAAPFIQNDRTMVPLRVISEALGATDLAFNSGVVTFNINGQAFIMTVDQPLPGGMGTPVIVAGRTFVPLAFIINEMGATARWDSNARAAYIYID